MAVLQGQVKSIDRKSKTVELDDGRVIPLPEDLAFEILGSKAAHEKKKGMAEAVQTVQKGVSNLPGGESIGAFASSAGESSIFPKLATNFLDYAGEAIPSISTGEGQEGMGFFERLGENVSALRAGRREAKGQIAQENPIASTAGTIAGIGADIALPLPKGLPKNPIGQGAALGGLYAMGNDKSILEDPLGVAKDVAIGGGLGAGIGAVGSRLSKVAQDRAALRNHPELLAQHAAATTRAEKQFLAEMARKLDSVQSELRGAGIAKSALDVDKFIDREIGSSALAGTPQANKLSSFFQSIEKSAPEHLNSTELKNLFNTIETRLTGAAAEEVPIYNAFKAHLVDRLPIGAAGNAVKHKYGTRLLNAFEKDIDKSVGQFLADTRMVNDVEKVIGKGAFSNLQKEIKRFVKTGFDKINPTEFTQDLTSGNVVDRMMWFLENEKKFESLNQRINTEIENIIGAAIGGKPLANFRGGEIQSLIKARDKLNQLQQTVRANLTKTANGYANAAHIYERDVLGKVSSKISNAVGVPNPLTSGRLPTNARPVPTPAPAAPQVGGTARFFETPDFYKTNAKKLANIGKSAPGAIGIGTLGYALGAPKAAVAAGAGVGAAGLTALLRGATSPGALGEFARQGIQRGGVRMIVESIADKYPSYRNGVLTDPQDRRSAAAEIEQDQDINLEDKAVLQARINRGLNIETLIEDEEL